MKQIQARRSAEGGFTLIEVLIGISIFAIGMLAVLVVPVILFERVRARQTRAVS